MKIFYVPANSSAASVTGHLYESEGIGVILESEADTMAFTMKQDWGSYSDISRKSFQHETISYSRKKDREFIEVNKPRLAIALAGTPSQVGGIIKSAADGLFSRFIFYSFSLPQQWRDVSANRENDLTTYFKGLGQSMLDMYKILEIQNYKFDLEDRHWRSLNERLTGLLRETDKLTGSEAPSTVKRLGLITYRIAKVFSVLRAFEKGMPNEVIVCTDDDFANAPGNVLSVLST